MKNFRTLAGMAVFALGVLATSSCSKDDFFGLNEYEYLDYSKKTEIAMSQEYTDYANACYKIADLMKQLSDSTAERNRGEINGRPISYLESGEPIMDLLEKLKNAYPELKNADLPDIQEIRRIALLKNKAINKVAASQITAKSWEQYDESQYFIGYLNCETTHYWSDYPNVDWAYLDRGKWGLCSCVSHQDAVDDAIWCAPEYSDPDDFKYGTGGLFFSDGSAACVIGSGEWPSIINYVASAETDFLIVPRSNISDDLISTLRGYTGGGRLHLFVDRNGEIVDFSY